MKIGNYKQGFMDVPSTPIMVLISKQKLRGFDKF